jgi:hypothetical protein
VAVFPNDIEEAERFTCEYDSIVLENATGQISLAALRWLSKHNIPIFFLDFNGETISSILPPVPVKADIRVAQIQAATNVEKKVAIARAFVQGKLNRSLEVLTWHGTPSEAKQAEYMVAETLVYLGNPSVIGVRWYLLADEFPWSRELSDGGVLYANGTRKQSFYALERLWNSLIVNETIQSLNGVATFRGLAGNYSISVEGYEVEPSTFHASEEKQNTFSLVLRPTTGITSTLSGSVSANRTVPSQVPQLVENPVLILAGALGIAIVLLAAIILRRRKPSPQ